MQADDVLILPDCLWDYAHVLIKTVSSQPRPWASYTNINVRENRNRTPKMNSAEDVTRYNDNNSHYCSPILARRNVNSYNFPEKSPKKDKKWSFGSLFRRKKKESDSSSDEENQSKGFLQKKKKKADKRKRVNNTVGFDQVVIPTSPRQNGYKEETRRVLSEPLVPKNNFIPASDFTSRFIPLKDSNESLNRNELNRSNNSLGSPSVCSLGRRKKVTVKARAEARRDTSKGEESSDDDSQISIFRSDESLFKHRDGSLSRRSRAARTQRYLRRRSKDEEVRDQPLLPVDLKNPNLKEDKIEKIKNSLMPKPKISYTNSAPSSRSNFSGLTTIPPSHNTYNKYRTVGSANEFPNNHISYHSYNVAENKYNLSNGNGHRSVSYDSNMHNSTSPEANGILNVEFPLYQSFNQNSFRKHPPPPPPRDPRRIITVQNGDCRPMSYSFENGYKTKVSSDYNVNKPDNNQNFLNHNFRSTSDDHISSEPLQRVPLIPRPSSTTPEMSRLQKLSKNSTEGDEKPNTYRYLTDKNPRSRKPICIQADGEQPTWSQKTFKFWRQKDAEVLRNNNRKSTPASPLIFTAQTHVTTNIFLPNTINAEESTTPVFANTNPDSLKRQSSPFRPIMSPKESSPEEDASKHKSTNLEDALDELEAIYNSLHLGDEDLLDRAEKREADVAQKNKDIALESFPDTHRRSTTSDSTFGFDPKFDSTRKKRVSNKSEPNIKTDDMAFRKLNRERCNTINDPQSVVSNISYLLTSPVFNAASDELSPPKVKSDEPDVTYDDVVFRNVMHTNNTLKVADPQPPFGIPVGPISPAANSDYLHATPEPIEKQAHGSKKVPDVVKDDLAYRNLRKDANKGNSLHSAHISDEFSSYDKTEGLKKKRAVRSLSANISNLMHKNDIKLSTTKDDYSSPQNLTQVADALEMARQILRDKEDKINATRQAFMSDGELKYRRFESTSPTEQRMRFLNEMKSNSPNHKETSYHKLQITLPINDGDRLESKPPTPDRRASRISKESTPIPSSPSEDAELKKQLRQSTLDELLTSLAVETRETNDKITEELNLIDQQNTKPVDDHEDNVKSHGDHIKLCEKLLQCVVASNELLAANTEEFDVSEEVDKIKIDPIPEIVANVVLLPSDKSKLELNPVSTEVYSESDHDYVNIQSNDETEKEGESEDVLDGFKTNQDGKDEDLLAAFEAVDETLRNMNNGRSTNDDCQTVEQTDKCGGNS
ncbi:hypothetical protein RN001_009388 [Aquatica leii]|uniref:Uncharacterized protein n=1 Tax=Aquatica leii TaxID=1421715 RepID=A0AAN7P581_9COLE|nr:hypothetical protein RN001_009388 [Aquatica leii]